MHLLKVSDVSILVFMILVLNHLNLMYNVSIPVFQIVVMNHLNLMYNLVEKITTNMEVINCLSMIQLLQVLGLKGLLLHYRLLFVKIYFPAPFFIHRNMKPMTGTEMGKLKMELFIVLKLQIQTQ